MSYEQAFHTCCRDGLTTPTLAFQYQAASTGLDRDRLALVARQMVGYVPPSSVRPDPSDAEIAQFPVSLRYLKVPGVGATVSRTVYIGREDRAAGSGRFGNYFSHVLAALDRDRFEPGRHPIETWGSPGWRTDATPSDGVPLDALPPGRVSPGGAERALADGGRSLWLPIVFDWLEDAFADRTRIVVLDDSSRAWAWIAAVALALPASVRDQVTFDTFAGDPERSGARICVADPGIDRNALARRELTGEVRVVDLAAAPPPPRGLLARAIADGRKFVPRSAADEDVSLSELGLVLAIEGTQAIALEQDDLPSALSVITTWLTDGELQRVELERAALLFNEALDAQLEVGAIDQETLETLWRLVAELRTVTPRLLSVAARLALRLPERTDNVTVPAVGREDITPDVVGDAISLVMASDLDGPTERRHLELLRRLRLVGINSGLDRRVGRVAARNLGTSSLDDWLERLGREPEGRVVVEQVIRAACAGEALSEAALDFLLRSGVDQIHDQLCGPGDAFPVTRARAVALSQAHPERRRRTLEWALGYASNPEEAESLVDIVYGSRLDPAAMREVLRSLSATNQRPSRARIDAGWTMLEAEDPFSDDPSVSALASDLHTLDSSGTTRSIYVALWLDKKRTATAPDEWIAEVGRWSRKLNDWHLRGLLRRAARGVISDRMTTSQHPLLVEAGIATLKQPFFDCYWEELTWALRDTTRADLVAEVLVIWGADSVPRAVGDEAIEVRLVKALKPWDDQAREQVGIRLGRSHSVEWVQYWQEWCELFPASGTVGRTIGKLFTRRPHD